MSSQPTKRGPQSGAQPDRRAPRPSGLVYRIHALLARPIGIQWNGRWPRLVLVERRRPRIAPPQDALAQLCDELTARLLVTDDGEMTEVMRHLVHVRDVLRRKDWAGVADLPSRVLGKALTQAQMLASDESSPALQLVVDKLHVLVVGAELREAREARAALLAADPSGEPTRPLAAEYRSTMQVD